jgi:hypothetical protein
MKDNEDDDEDDEGMGEGHEAEDEEQAALNRAVLSRMAEMQRGAKVDCATQCEDPEKEAGLKKKLRVKKRKLITAQADGSNRLLLPAHSLPNTNPYKLSRYRTSSISLCILFKQHSTLCHTNSNLI